MSTPVAVILKGYPRLSETFIAQEILALECAGMDLQIVSLRRPTDERVHPVHKEIRATVTYLPEYLPDDPMRVLRGWRVARRRAPCHMREFSVGLAALVAHAGRDRLSGSPGVRGCLPSSQS